MIDLKQNELHEWMVKNFGGTTIEHMALGMSEEVGEICHHILKGQQRIRGGINGINKKEVADGVADTLVFGIQLLSKLGLDAEKEIALVIEQVLKRDWNLNPDGDGEESQKAKCPYYYKFGEDWEERKNCGSCVNIWDICKAKNIDLRNSPLMHHPV